MSPREGAPFPNPSTAFTLAAAALFVATLLVPGLAAGSVVGVTLGSLLGFGGIGLLAARRVPEPAALRLGMTPFPLRAAAPVLLLIPFALLVSEVDNWIRIALAAKPSEDLGVPQPLALEAVLFGVLLQPVLNEFFFRGVLFQGCAAALTRWRAALFVAALEVVWMPSLLVLGAFLDQPVTAGLLSQTASTFAIGVLLGTLRIATGSLLPGIALSGCLTALSAVASAFPDRLAIPGFNAPGATTPPAVLLPAAASVALGLWLLSRQLASAPGLPPISPPSPRDDEEAGPLF